MRKPTAKMIEALVELFEHRGGPVTNLPGITTSTWAGLVERELVTAGPAHALTDVGLRWLVDNRHAVIVTDDPRVTAELWAGHWVSASTTALTADQMTAEVIRHRDALAREAADLAKADAIRAAQARRITPGQVVTSGWAGLDFVVLRVEGDSVFGETRQGFAVEADLMKCSRVAGSLHSFGGPLVADCERFGRCLNAYHVGCVTDATPTPGLYRGVPNRERPAAPLGVDDAWDAAYLVVDQAAQVAHALTEGHGVVVSSGASGPALVTVPDRDDEVELARYFAPDSVTDVPAARSLPGSTVVDVLTDGSTVVDVVDDEEQTCGQPWVRPELSAAFTTLPELASAVDDAVTAVRDALVTGLPELNAALTPGECLLLDRVPASVPTVGQWVSAGHGRKANALARLVDRGLAYVGDDIVQHHHYLTEGGALVVRYRRALAASDGTETPERVHAFILSELAAKGAETHEQVRAGVVVSSVSGDANGPVTVAVDPSARNMMPNVVAALGRELGPDAAAQVMDRATDHGYFGSEVIDAPATLSVVKLLGRLRRGLVIERAERVALADLLDTVRRSSTALLSARPAPAAADVANTYRAHFGDPR